MQPIETDANKREWYDAADLGIQGRGWSAVKHPFDRLPAEAESRLPREIWTLGRLPSGLYVRFASDSKEIFAKWRLRFRTAVPHMPDVAVAGLDLYAREQQSWRWVGIGQPDVRGTTFESCLVDDAPPGEQAYTLYLPLFSPLRYLHIGVLPGTAFRSLPEDGNDRICVYGTSMTQGASVSRPGKAYPAILGRWSGQTVLNLGFSGHAQMHDSVAELLAELDCQIFLIDCLLNMQPDLIRERTRPFLQIIANRQPRSMIALVDCVPYQNAWFARSEKVLMVARNEALRIVVQQLLESGISNVRLLPASNHDASDGEGASGRHATEIGHFRLARGLYKELFPGRLCTLDTLCVT